MPRDPVLRAVVSLALSLAFLVGSAGPSQAKEYEVDGIVDCGRSSGEGCSIERVLFLRTEHVTGRTERIRIDVRGFRTPCQTSTRTIDSCSWSRTCPAADCAR